VGANRVPLSMHILAALEVAGRHAVSRSPALRARLTRAVRRPAAKISFTLENLRAHLNEAGLGDGKDLLVHCAWDGMSGLQAKPSELIALLRSMIGEEATLLMPSHPIAVIRQGQHVFDVTRTPSAAGIVSESFRRMPGVQRSPFPIAPVLAAGPDAAAYTSDFRELSNACPYGPGSPYVRLAEKNGLVLFLGIDFIRVNTLVHVAFDVLGDANPVADYYEARAFMVVRDGREERWEVRQQRGALENHFAGHAFKRMMLQSKCIRICDLGGLPIALLDAARFVSWHLPLAREHGWPYWGYRRRSQAESASARAAA
jgi:aminoglycoside N3'-acetyltransferase